MSSRAVGAGRAEVEVALRDRIAQSLPALERRLKATGAAIGKVGAAVGISAKVGLGIFGAAAKSFAGAGTELVNLSVQTGVSVQALSALEFAAARTGASMDDVQEIITAIKDGKGLELWSSKSAGVLRLLQADVAGLVREAEQMGLVFSQQDVSAAVELSSALSTSALMLKSLWNAVGSAVAPAVTESISQMTKFVQPLVALIKNNKEVVRVLFGVLSVVSIVGTALAGLGAVIAGAGTALSFLSGAFIPLLAGAGILAAVGVAAFKFRDQLMEAWRSVAASISPMIDGLTQLYQVFSQTFQGIVVALGSGQLEAAANIAWLGMVAAAWTGVDLLSQAVDAGMEYLQQFFPQLDSVRDYFQSTFGGILQAILAGRWDLAGQIIMAKLRLGWSEGIDFLRDGWDGFVATMISGFRAAVDFIYDMFFEIGAKIARTIPAILEKALPRWKDYFAGQRQAIDSQIERERKATAEARKARSDPWDTAGRNVLDRQKRRDELRALIADLEQQAAAAYSSAGSPTISRVASQARADLTAAIAAARKEMERLADNAPKLDLPMGKSQMGSKTESRGTFSAVAATILGFGDNANKETATNTRKMVRQLAKVADNVGKGDIK